MVGCGCITLPSGYETTYGRVIAALARNSFFIERRKGAVASFGLSGALSTRGPPSGDVSLVWPISALVIEPVSGVQYFWAFSNFLARCDIPGELSLSAGRTLGL